MSRFIPEFPTRRSQLLGSQKSDQACLGPHWVLRNPFNVGLQFVAPLGYLALFLVFSVQDRWISAATAGFPPLLLFHFFGKGSDSRCPNNWCPLAVSFFGEGSPTKLGMQRKGTLILNSLLEDLAVPLNSTNPKRMPILLSPWKSTGHLRFDPQPAASFLVFFPRREPCQNWCGSEF